MNTESGAAMAMCDENNGEEVDMAGWLAGVCMYVCMYMYMCVFACFSVFV